MIRHLDEYQLEDQLEDTLSWKIHSVFYIRNKAKFDDKSFLFFAISMH